MKKFILSVLCLLMISTIANAQNVTETRLTKDQSILNGRSMKIYSSDNSKYVSITHNGTNAVIDASSGIVSFPDGIDAPLSGSGAISTSSTISSTNTNAAGESANPLDITSTLGIMNGSDDYTAIDINVTNANHTSTGNTVKALDISAITGDADATETAVIIGTGWDAALSAGEANITNVGDIAVDSVTGDDGTNVAYNDVNILELQQADLTAGSCTLGQLRLDTGGSAKELCYCQATNVWYCWSATTLTGPTD